LWLEVRGNNRRHRIAYIPSLRTVTTCGTHVCFFHRGTIVTYKLSPNLRTIMKSPKKGVQIPTETLELEKLHTVLNSVRE